MRIEFKNLGPLHECKVTLGDLTIVTGHNNTGKTYVTYGVFGLLAGWRHWLRLPNLSAVAQELLTKGHAAVDIQQFAGDSFRSHLNRLAHTYQENLARVLAAEPDRFKDTKVHLGTSDCPDVAAMTFDINQTLASGDTLAIVKVAGETTAKVTRQGTNSENDSAGIPPMLLVERWLSETITDLVFSRCFPRAFIASTERTGAAIFQRELMLGRNRIFELLADLKPGEQVDPWALMQRMAPSYAYPVQQNVEFLGLGNLEALQKQQGKLATERPDIIDALESLCDGTYKATKDGVFFSPKGKGVKLRLGESSSASRTLLDLSYYIRHVLRPGDCFMIDEPELNLHPRNQRRVARLIARLVNAGVKVFLTTHSDYVIRELNTLILLAGRKGTKQSLLAELGYAEQELIPASGVRFYRTTEDLRIIEGGQRKRRVPVLEECKVTDTAGIEVETFDEEINELNRIQDAILYTPETDRSDA